MNYSKMTHADKLKRRDEKKELILSFLANGEQWTTHDVLMKLLGLTTTPTKRTLELLVVEKAIQLQTIFVEGKKLTVIGITQKGIGIMRGTGKPFYQNSINPSYAMHHILTQQARITAERAGGTKWRSGKTLHDKGLLKVPDGIFQNATNRRVAIEVENSIKSPSRFAVAISLHLQEMANKNWNEVHYLVPDGQLENILHAFAKIDLIPVKGSNIKLPVEARKQFKFFNFSEWQPN